MKYLYLIATILMLAASPALAQDDFPVPFTWDMAGITFLYPSSWDTPVAGGERDIPTLRLARALAALPDIRPPGVPTITFALYPPEEDFAVAVQAALSVLGLQPDSLPTTVNFLNSEGEALTATGANGDLYGVAWVGMLPDGDVLVIAGRVQAALLADFEPVFALVVNSAAVDTAVQREAVLPDDEGLAEAEVTYGVIWRTLRTFADGDTAFLDLIGLVYASDGRLYSYDFDQGLIQLDAATGSVLGSFPNEDILEPTSITADAAGTVYVADLACACVYVFNPASGWGAVPITGFDENSPLSITAAPDGRLYGTNEDEEGMISVRVFQGGSQQQVIPLGEEVFFQPVLTVDAAGRVLALTDVGDVLALEGGSPVLLTNLGPVSAVISGLVVDSSGNYVLAAQDYGILILDAQGEVVAQPGRIVEDDPQPGEMVFPSGVALGPDGMLYFADSDGQFGAVTALSARVPQGRIGETILRFDLPVQGELDSAVGDEQTWAFEGLPGDRVTITATDLSGAVDLYLRLIAPDGSEVAFNEAGDSLELLSPTDPQIVDHLLGMAGTYTVVVGAVSGEGSYGLSLNRTTPFVLEGDSVTLRGALDDIRLAQRWSFEAETGEIVTITLRAASGDLDTVVYLFDPLGTLLADNDDAEDADLGSDSQIVGITLPASGVYTIAAGRFAGSGDYELTVTRAP